MKQINNLPSKEFKVMVIKLLIKLRRMDEHNADFNKEVKTLKSTIQSQRIHTVTEVKNTRGVLHSRADDAEEQVSDVEDKAVEINQLEQQKVRRIKKMRKV